MIRKSKQKEAILRVVKRANSHPTAYRIYNQVREEMPNISLGTVYRNLKSLKQRGEILELSLADTSSRFDGNTQSHYHFRCEQCDRIFDMDGPMERKLNDGVVQKMTQFMNLTKSWYDLGMGFKVYRHRLEFYGLCKDCQS